MAWLPLICAFSGLLNAPGADGAAVAQVNPGEAGVSPQSAEDREAVRLEDVIITGRRGAARLPPEMEWGASEIDNLGAYDIEEAIARISQAEGFEAPPVIIVNGREVLNARDFIRFPPDALVRIEMLPRQAAAIYGEDPRRPVLNIVLQPEFRSRDGYLKASRPTAGGMSSLTGDARQSEILDNDTRQFGLQIARDTSLRAEERPSYLRDHSGSGGVTLRPGTDAVSANFSMTRALGDWSGSLSANAQTQEGRFTFLTSGQAAEIRRSASSLILNGGLGGEVGGWSVRLGLNGAASNNVQDGAANSRSRNLSVATDLSADRTLIDLTAGPVRMALSSRYSSSRTVTDAEPARSRLSTRALDLRGNLAIPLLGPSSSEERASLHWSDVSLTLGGTLAGLLGEAGQGKGLDVGLSGSPARKLRLNGQWSMSTDSPTAQLRVAPVYYGPPRTVFDFLTGESVEVLPLLGGNPDLAAQTSRRLSVSASAGPFTRWGVQGRVSFQRARSTDGFGVVPDLSPAVEAAFPERFIRDADGRLVSIDQRPINLGSTLVETLSSGLNLSIPSGGTRNSWQIGLDHTLQLTSVITLREGLPEMDRLAGDGGGTPRHQVSVHLNGSYGQLGVNAAAQWRSASRIRRDSGRDGPNDLQLSDFSKVDLRLSYLVGSVVPQGARTRRYDGLRLELEIANLFDTRPKATLGDGRPAPGYGRDSQDPVGRVVRMTLSKRF